MSGGGGGGISLRQGLNCGLVVEVFHLASFPIYASGLPPGAALTGAVSPFTLTLCPLLDLLGFQGLASFCTWACGMLHDPVFAGLSARASIVFRPASLIPFTPALEAALLLRGGPGPEAMVERVGVSLRLLASSFEVG